MTKFFVDKSEIKKIIETAVSGVIDNPKSSKLSEIEILNGYSVMTFDDITAILDVESEEAQKSDFGFIVVGKIFNDNPKKLNKKDLEKLKTQGVPIISKPPTANIIREKYVKKDEGYNINEIIDSSDEEFGDSSTKTSDISSSKYSFSSDEFEISDETDVPKKNCDIPELKKLNDQITEKCEDKVKRKKITRK